VAAIGTFTALMAGIIALTQTDLKRVLAYSTISHSGYMFPALASGTLPGIAPACSISSRTPSSRPCCSWGGQRDARHATIDMRRFGGLRRLMPVDPLDGFCSAAWRWPASFPGPVFGARTPSWRPLIPAPMRAGCSKSSVLVRHGHGLFDGPLYLPRIFPYLPRAGTRATRSRPPRPRVAAGRSPFR